MTLLLREATHDNDDVATFVVAINMRGKIINLINKLKWFSNRCHIVD